MVTRRCGEHKCESRNQFNSNMEAVWRVRLRVKDRPYGIDHEGSVCVMLRNLDIYKSIYRKDFFQKVVKCLLCCINKV